MSKVELIGYYGSDLVIAQTAWTSTNRDLTPEKIARVPKMISTLYNEGHKTPFERGQLHFLVEADIASHIHLLKHRMANINGESARYKELKEDKYIIPTDWLIGSEDVLQNAILQKWVGHLKATSEYSNRLYHQCLEELTPILGRKRAKESARYFKMYNSEITTDVMMNISCFSNFYKLRHKEGAQKEIYDIAEEMMVLAKNIEGNPFETTLSLIENI